ncbi:acyl transferase/acyl hydrolase/lysophospholipase [Absidia repens]|uniref:Acyl transferase/acyl hydrolase/lysophospholipase n=1 Tax=Absidia repens TaxID=90262 RepID=A0A1X2I1W3_9FUNG|nr:acyl transferase/acyl hydrolase/lysophospholipase [Absidia repens]
MMYLLRGSLLRNFGGISDRKLFSRSYLGTKQMIEDYMDEVISQIEYIESSPDLDPQMKMKFFSDTRQGFGRSALILNGASAFALYHIGVVKALNEQGLLPRIISGTAVSAMIASLICIHTDDELPYILQPDGINLTAFSKKSDKGHFKRRVTRLLKYGYLMDMKVLQECVHANVGDLTFEEAYARSNRVLNISVSSTRTQEVPQLLNYMTAPNVLIWSAACCSTASAGLFSGSDLLAKDGNGNIVKWNSSEVAWNPWTEAASSDRQVSSIETPLHRLSELFNVNHFIVSQASSYAIPFLSPLGNLQQDSIWNKLGYVVASEIRHRLYQLDQFHLLPRIFRGLIELKMTGNVNIVPELSLSDFNVLFSNPTHASLAYWILHGERSAWPLVSLIRTRCMIELALDESIIRLKSMNVQKAPIVVTSMYPGTKKKRARSMH